VLFHDRQQRASEPIVVLNILLGLSSCRDEILWDLVSKLQAVRGVVAVELEPGWARRHISRDSVGSRDYIFLVIK
jgi:hypothetical protein